MIARPHVARRIVGSNVRKLRLAAKIRRQSWPLAWALNISGLELGQRNPTVVTLWHLGKALGVSMSVFLDGKSKRVR